MMGNHPRTHGVGLLQLSVVYEAPRYSKINALVVHRDAVNDFRRRVGRIGLLVPSLPAA